MAGFHDVISKLDGNRQILTDGNVDIPFRSFIVDTLLEVIMKVVVFFAFLMQLMPWFCSYLLNKLS